MKVYIPENKRVISIKDYEALELQSLVEINEFADCLETGLAYGQSACYILDAASKPRLTSCDPFQTEDYDNIGLKNIQNNGYADRHTYINDKSELALPDLIKKEIKFDFIFIDGDHKFDGAFIDFFFAAQLLKPNGIVVFHDMWMRSLALTYSYIKNNRKDFKEIRLHSKNMTAFRKIGSDERDGMHFREFYSSRSLIRFHINRLAWENDTYIGKLINSIKAILR